jgi:hypothetical protein
MIKLSSNSRKLIHRTPIALFVLIGICNSVFPGKFHSMLGWSIGLASLYYLAFAIWGVVTQVEPLIGSPQEKVEALLARHGIPLPKEARERRRID